jgi:tRNA dimethylallyltransferase
VPFSAWQTRRPPPFRTLFVGLDLPRERLYARIDARVLEQMAAGLLDEVRSLVGRGYDSGLTAMSGFGYRELAAHLRGAYGLDEAVTRYQQATRNYARRQLSWFRPDGRIRWLDAAAARPEDVLGLWAAWRAAPPAGAAGAAGAGDGGR